jgi:ABC-type bacteriocin/lantibiotic exporter with double-glycine peptidase domain
MRIGMENNENRRSIYKRIGKYLKRLRSPLISVLILKLLLIPVAMASPYLFRHFIDDVLADRRTELLIYILSGFVLIFFVKFFLDMLHIKSANKLRNRFAFDLRCDLWDSYFSLSFEKQDKMDSGDLKMRIDNDVTTVSNMVNEQLLDYFLNIITAVIYFISMLFMDWEFTLFVFLSIPVAYAFGLLIAKGTKNINEKIRKAEGEYRSKQFDTLISWREVKSHNLELGEYRKFINQRHKIAKLGIREIFFWYLGMLLYFSKEDFFTKLLIYFIGGLLILSGSTSVGMLMMFSAYFTAVFNNIDGINQKNITLKGSIPALFRIFELLDKRNETQDPKPKFKTLPFKKISIENVSFGYDKRIKVLEDIDLEINIGEHIAIVGKSGCGKSTLIKLILKLYNPWEGRIRIDDMDLDEVDTRSYYTYMGVVMQDSYLFNMTIRENLLIAKPHATKNELDSATRKADIYDFISTLDKGYETIIGERGIKLSGGQKQRLVLARVFLKDPLLFIFDEATSSLDHQSEQKISSTVFSEDNKHMAITIAHRFSTITHAKKIVVMDDGRIVALGSHKTLMKTSKTYRELYNSQS